MIMPRHLDKGPHYIQYRNLTLSQTLRLLQQQLRGVRVKSTLACRVEYRAQAKSKALVKTWLYRGEGEEALAICRLYSAHHPRTTIVFFSNYHVIEDPDSGKLNHGNLWNFDLTVPGPNSWNLKRPWVTQRPSSKPTWRCQFWIWSFDFWDSSFPRNLPSCIHGLGWHVEGTQRCLAWSWCQGLLGPSNKFGRECRDPIVFQQLLPIKDDKQKSKYNLVENHQNKEHEHFRNRPEPSGTVRDIPVVS